MRHLDTKVDFNFSRGCVTPAQIANWSEENGGDPELIDGYDELCPESKAKVDYALEHGHVADEDWKGVSALSLRSRKS